MAIYQVVARRALICRKMFRFAQITTALDGRVGVDLEPRNEDRAINDELERAELRPRPRWR